MNNEASKDTDEITRPVEVIDIERMSYGSDAVGRLASGKAVFVTGGVPGDVAEISIYEDKSRFARARIERIVEPSDLRVDDVKCPLVDVCGGCPWSHLTYDAQCDAKWNNVIDALERTAHMDADRCKALVEACVPSDCQWGYRNKLELTATYDDRGYFMVGYCREGTNDLQPIDMCPLAYESIERSPRALRGSLSYLQGCQDLGIYRIGVRASMRTNSLEVVLWTPPDTFPRMTVARTIQVSVGATSVARILAEPGKERAIKKVERLEGRGFWEERFCDEQICVSAPSFFQVNIDQAEKLVALVIDGLCVEEGCKIADLYAGVGTFSLPLARAGASVVAVELSGSAAHDLRRNVNNCGVEVEVICDDVERILPDLGTVDAMVVDPPRCGLTQKVIEEMIQAHPQRIAYVSCDPQTWARDTALLEDQDYRCIRVVPIDMFPQTYHGEVFSIFERVHQ